RQCPATADRAPAGGARPVANRNHDVGMGLISLIEHCPPGGWRALCCPADLALPLTRKGSAFYVAVRDNFSRPNGGPVMATLTIASKNYGSWSLRGWLLCKMAGLKFDERQAPSDDPSTRAELLLLSPSFLVPCLTHDGVKVWDTLAIAEYVNELKPDAKLIPPDRVARAHCRAIAGEMHSGFSNLRSALPMNLKAHYPGFK